ncbi:unnamed protein product, partial [Rotaria socialis]
AAAHPGAKSISGYHESAERGATTKAGAQGGRTTGAATHPGGMTDGPSRVGFTTTSAPQPRQTWDLGSKESGERVMTTKASSLGGGNIGAATHPGDIT